MARQLQQRMPGLIRFCRKARGVRAAGNAIFIVAVFATPDFLDFDFADLDLRTGARLFFDFAGFWAAESDFMMDRITDSTAAAAATLAADFAALITWALALVMKLFFLAIYLSSARN